MDLNALDAELGGPMRMRARGAVVELRDAADMPWRTVAAAASDDRYFLGLVWPHDAQLPAAGLPHARRAWAAHHGIPDAAQIQRLVYTMERWGSGIEYDLRHHVGVSAGELWRARRWRELQSYIDQLPGNSHKNRLISSDEEYMTQVLEHAKDDGKPGRPSMSDWSLEAKLLTELVNEVKRNTMVTEGVAAGKKGKKPKMDPTLGPYSIIEKIRQKLREKSHDDFKSMLLRDRGGADEGTM